MLNLSKEALRCELMNKGIVLPPQQLRVKGAESNIGEVFHVPCLRFITATVVHFFLYLESPSKGGSEMAKAAIQEKATIHVDLGTVTKLV